MSWRRGLRLRRWLWSVQKVVSILILQNYSVVEGGGEHLTVYRRRRGLVRTSPLTKAGGACLVRTRGRSYCTTSDEWLAVWNDTKQIGRRKRTLGPAGPSLTAHTAPPQTRQ